MLFFFFQEQNGKFVRYHLLLSLFLDPCCRFEVLPGQRWRWKKWQWFRIRGECHRDSGGTEIMVCLYLSNNKKGDFKLRYDPQTLFSPPGWGADSSRCDGEILHGQEKHQKQKENGKSYESAEGTTGWMTYLFTLGSYKMNPLNSLCFVISGQKHKKKRKVEVFNFSAIHLIHDPQGRLTVLCCTTQTDHPHSFVLWYFRELWTTNIFYSFFSSYKDFSEKLLKQLEDSKERFEVKIMMMELISRLVGIHEVIEWLKSISNQYLFTVFF